MSAFDVFIKIYAQLFNFRAVPYVLVALALTVFAWFWRGSSHSPGQRRAVHWAFSLWLLGPVTAFNGAVFRFTGPVESRGEVFNELAAGVNLALLALCVILGLVLVFFGRGVRINIIAAMVPVLFVQFLTLFLSGCAIVGVCV